jgi:hypothetical protein
MRRFLFLTYADTVRDTVYAASFFIETGVFVTIFTQCILIINDDQMSYT